MKLLLLDPGWDHTPFLVRELARANFDVTLATPIPPDSFLTAYCRQVPGPWSAQDPAAFSALMATWEADLVIPLSEDIMGALWKLPPDVISKVFPATTPLQRGAFADRTQMYALAGVAGVPVPKMTIIQSESDLVDVLASMGTPLVLRGTQGLAGLQVKIVSSLEEAREAFRDLVQFSPGPPFAQQFVEGRRFLVGGLFHHGEVLQYFAQTTIEAVRPPTGPSIRVRSVQDERLISHTKRIFSALSWTGLACAEFMQGADGEYRFLEINPRPWAAIYAAHCCGVPLLRTFADYLRGEATIRRSNYAESRDVVLFPQYLSAKVSSGRFPRWGDVPYYLRSMLDAPWGSPHLLLHLLRRAFWSRRG